MVGTFLSFIVARWRVILIAGMLGLVAWHYLALRNAVSECKQSYANLISENNEAMLQRRLENKEKERIGRKQVGLMQSNYEKQLQTISETNKELKDEIDDTKRDVATYRKRLRDTIAKQTATGLPKDDPDKPAGRDGNATLLRILRQENNTCTSELDVCQQAGAVAAADYNLCKSYVDKQQEIIGVGE